MSDQLTLAMDERFTCPSCKSEFTIPEGTEHASEVVCPACSARLWLWCDVQFGEDFDTVFWELEAR